MGRSTRLLGLDLGSPELPPLGSPEPPYPCSPVTGAMTSASSASAISRRQPPMANAGAPHAEVTTVSAVSGSCLTRDTLVG